MTYFNYWQLCVETLPPAAMPYPAPLDEGVDEAAYLKHIAPPPQEIKEEEAGDEKIDDKVTEIAGDPQNDKGMSVGENE